jgi:hypothetical protein
VILEDPIASGFRERIELKLEVLLLGGDAGIADVHAVCPRSLVTAANRASVVIQDLSTFEQPDQLLGPYRSIAILAALLVGDGFRERAIDFAAVDHTVS